MKAAKIIVSTIVVLVIGFFVWNYFAGPMKHRRDMHAFADSIRQCEASTHDIWMSVSGQTLEYTVDGQHDGLCGVRLETSGPHVVHCRFEPEDLPKISQAFDDMADSIGLFGGYTVRISTSDPDPLSQALNSSACNTSLDSQ